MKRVAIAAGLAIALFAGPALADKDPRLGDQVDRICFAGNISSWRETDDGRKAVLLRSRVNRWHYVRLSGACSRSDIRFAQSIALDRRPAGGGCLTRGDNILFFDSAFGPSRDDIVARCTVTGIYDWDDDAGAEDDQD